MLTGVRRVRNAVLVLYPQSTEGQLICLGLKSGVCTLGRTTKHVMVLKGAGFVLIAATHLIINQEGVSRKLL